MCISPISGHVRRGSIPLAILIAGFSSRSIREAVTAASLVRAYLDLGLSLGTAGCIDGLPSPNAIPDGRPSARYCPRGSR